MKNALIVYSGGMDSTVLLYEHREHIALAVSFDYGSKHAARELECATRNCQRLGIEHIIIPLAFMGQHFKSALLEGGADIPDGDYAADNMTSTVVPFRNGIMLSIAVGLAESRGLEWVLIAAHFGDHEIYPDCRAEFIGSMTHAAHTGTYNNVVIEAPYAWISKRDIAERGRAVGVDFADTYSCYKGGETHCGTCATCRERKEALTGFDPTKYES